MIKFKRILMIIFSLTLILLTGGSCSSEFKYPDESVFELSVNVNNTTFKTGEEFKIECALKNTSNKSYFINHGDRPVAILMYDETNALAEEEEGVTLGATTFEMEKKEEITAQKTYTIDKPGTYYLRVNAKIGVTTSLHSTLTKDYMYDKEIEIKIIQ